MTKVPRNCVVERRTGNEKRIKLNHMQLCTLREVISMQFDEELLHSVQYIADIEDIMAAFSQAKHTLF